MQRKSSLSVENLEARDVPAANIMGPLPPGINPSVLAASPTAAYSVDGSGNNVANPTWGQSGTDFVRLAPAEYGDGLSTPAGADRPSARVISNVIGDQSGQDVINDRMMSAMIYVWGQFIDHDMDLTNSGTAESFNVAVPTGDPSFDPLGTGTQVIPLKRSVFDAATGTNNARQQINAITSFLDGSMVYGSDATTATSLRTFSGGQLRTSTGNLLPTDATGFFQAGDIRVNENVELIAIQTLFVREHNYWAKQISLANPSLTDEQIYQKARAIVIGEIQSITYNQWLPALLGHPIAPYSGYKPNVNPSISNEFSTAGFRLGHSLLGDDIEFLDNNGNEVHDEVSLAEAFFNPSLVQETGIDPLLKYLSSDPASEVDTKVVDSVRNFLFGPPGAGGLDLVSLNIQRGRDHGLADYNQVRQSLGLPKVTSFAQITSDPALQAKLQQLYGSVDNIDLWVGALAEDHLKGSSVGPTHNAIMTDQFTRLRDGDRFWYQKSFSGPMLQMIQNTSLTDIIKRNTALTNVQQDPFFFRADISGLVFGDGNSDGKLQNAEKGLAGIQVELIDSEGTVVATTMTNAKGQYSFDVLDGVRTGSYQVRTVPDAGSNQPVITSPVIQITRGDQSARDVNLGVPPGKPKPPPPPPAKPDPSAVAAVFEQLGKPPRR